MQTEQNNTSSIKIFLVGLHTTFTQAKIVDFFNEKYANITRCRLITKMNKNGQLQNTGYGTLFVSDQDTYDRIIEEGTFILEGRRFFSKPFMEGNGLQKFKNSIKNRRAFLHNIDPEIDNKALRIIMKKFAPIEDAYIITKKGGNLDPTRPRFGFVMFKKVEDAKRIIKNKEIHYEGGRFYISEYKNEDERKKEQEEEGPESTEKCHLIGEPKNQEGYEQAKNQFFTKERICFVDDKKNTKIIKEFGEMYTHDFEHHCGSLRDIASQPDISRSLRKEFFDFLHFNCFNEQFNRFNFRDLRHDAYNLRSNRERGIARPYCGYGNGYFNYY